jgi:anti-sigma B factor antagonist
MVTESKIRRVEPDITIVEIAGRLGMGNTASSIESAIRKLIDEGARKLVVDVSGLSYIDSAGIGMLIGCNGHIDQNGGRMRIAGAQGLVQKSFAIVHVGKVVPLDMDVESACAAIAAGSASA